MSIKIGFCGGGNMGKAIMKGILGSGVATAKNITVYDSYKPTLDALKKELNITTAASEIELARESSIIILAVKPNVIQEVLATMSLEIKANTIVVSIAAGFTLKRLEELLPASTKVVRVMPNTPALVGAGMSALSPNANLTEDEKAIILKIFSSFGEAEIVPEHMMDSVVGLSGSGPAYVYMFIEALADGAVVYGMPRDKAYKFAAQTVLGSAKMVLESGLHPGALKDMVCSPGGTTIAAVKALEKGAFRSTVMDAVAASAEKNRKM